VIDIRVPVDRQLAGDAEIDLRFASTGHAIDVLRKVMAG